MYHIPYHQMLFFKKNHKEMSDQDYRKGSGKSITEEAHHLVGEG